MTGNINFEIIFTWILSIFFIIGGVVNWIAPKSIRKDYERWNYPTYFHYITAILEITVSIFLLFINTRWIGFVLGLIIMGAAISTVIYHREYKRVIEPLVILILIFLCCWLVFS